jgi:hypothetical protein
VYAQKDQKPVKPKPPKGFTALFNGRDLTGWRGRQPNYDPEAEAALSKEELATKQAAWNAERDAHWSVDTAKGEIVSDGKNPHLATAKDYGDFELYVDWLMVSHNGDSGIYLRGTPQVQIWDPDNPREVRNGAPKGSGALWNNKDDNPGKWPLVKADNPVGEWNTFHVKMIGPKVWIWLNDKLTVDGQVMDNYHDQKNGYKRPIAAKGPIELQTHNSEMRFRNIYIREIPPGKS